MRKIFILLTGLFLLACSSNEKGESKVKYNDLAIDNLKGDVQTIEEAPYKTDSTGKMGDMDSCCITVTQFDGNGNAVKYTSKDSKGTVKNESVYTRHESGLWMGSDETKEGGKPSGSIKATIDDQGQYTLVQTFDSTGKPDVYYKDISQNEFGQAASWKEYDKDSVFRQEGAAKFEKNLQVSFVIKDSVGNDKQTYASKYNDKGEQTENATTTITKDSTTTNVIKYTYETHDDIGNWTQRTTWDDKGKATGITKRTYTYRKK